ncbi:helix-turn-helix domain-containing protein [Oceanisphaera ostreae]|uniref:Helix-turn-helix domain-containing protein n=1 Tax=Oceanisphaera ostreae TaxID=914151 RepID=A0ABW3KDI1_9GAMM
MTYLELGQAVRELRLQQKVSQQKMADHLAISRTTLNAFELGRSGDVGLRKVMKMLDYLGAEISLREKSPFPTFEELRDGRM